MGGLVASASMWIRLDAVPQLVTGLDTALWGPGAHPFYLAIVNGQTSRLSFDYRNFNNTGFFGSVNGAIPGFNFHIAATYNGTTNVQQLYVNGYLVSTGTSTGQLTDPFPLPMVLGTGRQDPTINSPFTVDDLVYWLNYTLTPTDVLNIRNRTQDPFALSSSNIVWGITCTGTTGNTVTLSDPGVTYQGYANSNVNWITQVGSPTYGPKMIFSPYTLYKNMEVGGSGSTVYFCFTDVTGAIANVSAINSNPSISINSGSAIPLSNPIWGLTGGSQYSLPSVIYPLTTQVAPGDTVTVTASENWAHTSSGAPAALSNAPLVNNSGSSCLSLFTETSKPMSVGWNCHGIAYFTTVPIHNNIAKMSSRWLPDGAFVLGENGYVASFNEGTTSLSAIVFRVDVSPDYQGPVSGTYTLMWDGSDVATLQSAASGTTVTQRSVRLTGTTDNVEIDTLTATGSPVDNGLQVTIFGPNVSNIRIYAPNQVPSDSQQFFHKDLIRMLKGASCVRAMDLLGTNGSNIVNWSDFKSGQEFSYYQPKNTITANIATVTSTTNDGFFTTGAANVYLQMTTTAPHGLVTGHTVQFSGVAPILLTDSTFFNTNNFPFIIEVNSPTTFSYSAEPPSNAPVSGTQTPGGTLACTIGMTTVPVQDCVNLANVMQCDLWINVPALATDDCVTQMATVVANGLNSSSKVYVEYSNECWNFSNAFTQTRYCFGIGQTDPRFAFEPDPTFKSYRFYATRAGECHTIFTTVFASAGRPSTDIVRVYGGQMQGLIVAATGLNQAARLGNQVDVVAIAPYYDNGPSEPSFGAIYDSLNIDQLVDLSEYYMINGPFVPAVAAQAAALPTGVKLVCYEGGPQSGIPLFNGTSITVNGLNIAARSVSWGRHTRQATVYNYMMQQYANAGCVLYNAFSLAGTAGTIDANHPNSANWPCYFRWTMVPSPGDGSDGLYINSTNYTDVLQVNSTIGYGVNRWQQFQQGSNALLGIKVGSVYYNITIGY